MQTGYYGEHSFNSNIAEVRSMHPDKKRLTEMLLTSNLTNHETNA